MYKTITVEDINLAYQEINPNQLKTIFFIHGNSSSSKTWAKQLEDKIFADYRLIALDLPAHGQSAVSPMPEDHYSLKDLGWIISLAITKLANGQDFIIVGSSLGTNILCEALANLHPKGMALLGGCMVGGQYDFSAISLAGVDTSVIFSENPAEEALGAFYTSSVVKNNKDVLTALIADFTEVKKPFRSVMFSQSTTGGRLSDEILLLKETRVPVLVVFGKEEKIINPDYLDDAGLNTWRNTIYKIPDAGHLVHLDQPEACNHLLSEYARDIFKEPRAG